MWCPKCRSEYRSGYLTCTDCGTPLVEVLPKEPALDPVFLIQTEGDSAWELPELLRRMGIPCYLHAGNAIFIRMEPNQVIPGELYVDRRDLPMAKRCISMLQRPPLPVDADELELAYDEYMREHPQEPDEDNASGNVAWKVFLVLAALAIGCVLTSIFMK